MNEAKRAYHQLHVHCFVANGVCIVVMPEMSRSKKQEATKEFDRYASSSNAPGVES